MRQIYIREEELILEGSEAPRHMKRKKHLFYRGYIEKGYISV
jgi:hypothetical protein